MDINIQNLLQRPKPKPNNIFNVVLDNPIDKTLVTNIVIEHNPDIKIDRTKFIRSSKKTFKPPPPLFPVAPPPPPPPPPTPQIKKQQQFLQQKMVS